MTSAPATRNVQRRVIARNLRHAINGHGSTIADLAEAIPCHRRTIERWMDPAHPSTPVERKRKLLELLLDQPPGWLSEKHEEVSYDGTVAK